MTSEIIFTAGALLSVAICIGIVAYVRNHLRLLLIELCGTADRASFWLVFCNVMLVLVPLLFALGDVPDVGSTRDLILKMAAQIRWALFGFVLTLGFFGVLLLFYIPKNNPPAASNAAR